MCNDGRIGRIEEGVMKEGEGRKLVDIWWGRIQRICLVCFLLEEEWSDHDISSCERISDELGRVGVGNWVGKKIESRYEAASCCYKCSRPGDMCSAASVGLSAGCVEADIIVPVVAVGWLCVETGIQSIVESIAGREMKDIHDVFCWMMRRHYERTLRYWGTHGFAVWMEVIMRNVGRFESELESDIGSVSSLESGLESGMELSLESGLESGMESSLESERESESESEMESEDLYG